MPLPIAPDIFVTNLALMPQPETMPTISPVPDTLAKTWDMVKDGPKYSGGSRTLTVVGKSETQLCEGLAHTSIDDAVAIAQDDVVPFQPLIAAASVAVEQTDLGKAVKEGIDHFFEGMPIFMNALDAIADLHPFIGGASISL